MAEDQQQPLQALVFGASGVSGYAIVKQLLTYPTPTTFSRVIGLTNRPLSKDIAQLPNDERIELYSDLDLGNREKTLFHLQHIPGIDHTTHVYYTAYGGHGSDFPELKRMNTEFLTNALGSCEIVCPKMLFVTLQTGGKAYGVEFVDKVPYNPPLKEDMPRIPDPYAQNIFYYDQRDILERAAAGKQWTFCEIRPDAIVGFVPQNNAMNIAHALALLLSLYRSLHGPNSKIPFPGTPSAYTALHTDTSADILARFHIYASLHPQKTTHRTFNVTDGPPTTWEAVWPKVCGYFGLVGTGPEGEEGWDVEKWMEEHKGKSEGWVRENGLREGALEATGFGFLKGVMGIGFRRDYDASAAREVGFTEERDHVEGYWMVIEELRRAKIIP